MAVSGAKAYTVSYTYDKNNRLLTSSKDTGTAQEITDYYYDPNGNTISANTGIFFTGEASGALEIATSTSWVEIFSYDGFNRLVEVNCKSGDYTYSYRPDGLRLSKSSDEGIAYYIWDGQNLSIELNAKGNVTDVYIRGINLIKSKNNGYYLYNAHGDVVQLTNGTGVITKSYDYDAFGNERNADPDDTNPFRYCGEYYDSETGTYYLRARYYDPATSRMLSEDTVRGVVRKMPNGQEIIDPLSLNLYTYAYNNPVLQIILIHFENRVKQRQTGLLRHL